jgi:peptidoglycan/xylan/chitin deacetylase (PgdA/CDA1 family)
MKPATRNLQLATFTRLLVSLSPCLLIFLVLLAACGPTATLAPVQAALSTVPVITVTPAPSETPSPTRTPTATPTPSPTPDPVAALQAVHANELGWILVLEYHMIEEPEGRWSRTPDNFRADVERLITGGYYPINLIDLARGYIDVPAGKSPVVLTFDDSSSGQCRYLDDGTVDPDSACGILLEMARLHPDDWQPRATFFILLDVDVPDRVVFGQPELAEKKLQEMVGWGFEIGSHTVSHFRLDQGTPDEIHWQLANSEARIESMVPGFEVTSLSVPLGMYPDDMTLIYAGDWEELHYDFQATVQVAGGASPSPFSMNFNPYRIKRTQAIDDELEYWLPFFEKNPEYRYVSDGDPLTAAIPDVLPEELQGILREDLPEGVVLIPYPAQP